MLQVMFYNETLFLLCGDYLQYTIMLLVGVNTFLHYVLHSIDLRSEDPWENKTIYMRYVDIGVGKRGTQCMQEIFEEEKFEGSVKI